MKKLGLIFACMFLVLNSNFANAAETRATQFDAGIELSWFEYEEPDFMKDEGLLYGIFGVVSHRLSEAHPIVLGLDSRFSFGYVDYESQNTGTLDDIRDYIFEVRGTAGYDIPMSSTLTVTPYAGLGYRYLNDDSSGERTTTGAAGYERESNYFYLPLGLKGVADLGSGWSVGLTGEYDVFLFGQQKSHLSDAIAGLGDVTNDQESGYGLRASLKVMKETETVNFFIEPFVRYWKIDDSEISPVTYGGVLVGFGLEPENNSTEVGFRAGVNF